MGAGGAVLESEFRDARKDLIEEAWQAFHSRLVQQDDAGEVRFWPVLGEAKLFEKSAFGYKLGLRHFPLRACLVRVIIEKEPRHISLCNSLQSSNSRGQMKAIKRAQPLNQGQFSRLVKITQATSRYSERDVLVLMLGHHCGMWVTEISRITVADVMQPSGKLRTEISLREAVTKGCRQRCAYLVTKPLIAAIEAYLSYRLDRGIGTELGDVRYRGLLPHQPLIFSSRGTGLSQNTKRRILETGEQRDYKACDSLQSHLTRLYKKAGIKDGSSHSGRRTFAGKVLAATGDIETVAQLLGHADISCSQRYLDVNQDTLCSMFETAL